MDKMAKFGVREVMGHVLQSLAKNDKAFNFDLE